MFAAPDSAPTRLEGWQAQNPHARSGRNPTAVTPDYAGQKRVLEKLERLEWAGRHLGLSGELVLLTITDLPNVALYTQAGADACKAAAYRATQGLPFYRTDEDGETLGLHCHVATLKEVVAEGIHRRPITDRKRASYYLSKCRLSEANSNCPERNAAAADEYLRAREERYAQGYSSLPRHSGFGNMPRDVPCTSRKPRSPVLALTLLSDFLGVAVTLCALLLALYAQAQEARRVARLDTLKRARQARAQQARHCLSTWRSRSTPQRHPQIGPQGLPSIPQRPMSRLPSTGPP